MNCTPSQKHTHWATEDVDVYKQFRIDTNNFTFHWIVANSGI